MNINKSSELRYIYTGAFRVHLYVLALSKNPHISVITSENRNSSHLGCISMSKNTIIRQ